ncbi:hypothetical protein EAS56_37785 [Bradyrhizobium guangzhouense]|nr:hypothetical protein EAS56_37785 [Bradyrhizobium guangzhouense]
MRCRINFTAVEFQTQRRSRQTNLHRFRPVFRRDCHSAKANISTKQKVLLIGALRHKQSDLKQFTASRLRDLL